ncbi:hypothetical protein [Paraburkholderia ferrariae]|uniref:hypothetical protein n=1 Tax=Paraburkholderia ferrariae TaxID=386056 RepID=UPI0012EC989D|nr:hypothetical protein [Paraburkholderia ferrariae]
MRRVALIGWCIATFAVCIAVALLIGRLTVPHYFEAPEWFKVSLRWVAYRTLASETYNRDSMDIEDACDVLLIFFSLLVATVIVVPASVFAWRRFVRPKIIDVKGNVSR